MLCSVGGTGPLGGGQVPTSYTMLGMSESRVNPKLESSGCRAPIVPNFGIHGSSIMHRSYEEPFAWKVVTSFENSVS